MSKKKPTVEEEPVQVSKPVLRELMKLAKHGRLTPDEVVREAEDPDSPLHEYFTWEDSVAGAKWRRHQARLLIGGTTFKVEYMDRVICAPHFVRDPAAAKLQGYVSQQQLRKEPANAREVMIYELGRAEALMARTIDLAATLNQRPAAASILKSIERLRRQLLNEQAQKTG